ncbi:ribonuclease R [Algiphilus sp.]|uniref:ribonuclease R n=1 Tax=Algiphilus sp. TaxID=1872431 RepID=UPI0025BC4702|nr:ribonuclease R [Algiphilus sp.]MCK5769628.1 ribonuclease R [Algiphilus sp.]
MKRKNVHDPRAWRSADPALTDEQRRYGQALPSREWILRTLREADGPRSAEQLAELLGIGADDPVEGFGHRLSAMVRDGQLVRNRRGGYGVPAEMSLVAGRVLAHKDGFGFLTPDDGGGDLFLSPQQMQRLWPGDRVVARAGEADRRGRREGAVVEILERGVQQVVGRYGLDHGVAMVVPENPRITHEVLIPERERGEARDGDMVVVDILSDPQPRKSPVGRVVEVLGEHLGPGMEIEAAIRAHGIPHEFPDDALAQAEALPDRVREADCKGRKDLRKLPLVTIDGEDARDFDDAVHARRTVTGWKLWVAIADVDAYVPRDTPLDLHARERGNSVYFPERVVPMLPEKISNGLCSLNPDVDRLCMVCEMQIRRSGEIVRSRFYEAVMRSHARLTYNQVAAALDGASREGIDKRLLGNLRELDALYGALAKAREQRGTVAFESGETRFIFDRDQKIERIVPVTRNRAHVIIEECMIAANVAAARFVIKHKRGALFRVHQRPTGEKVQTLREFLATRGLALGGGEEPEPADFQAVMQQAAGRPDQDVIQTMMLRAMMQARYAPDCEGHFGLALDEYAHFTSPIRRYPDLVLHRAIKRALRGVSRRDEPMSHEALEGLGAACSTTERRADEATRDVTLWLKCEYMQQHVGETFDGTISGVAPFGLFVTLDDIHVEGLVHITALDNDYYEHDATRSRLVGRRSGRKHGMGDSLRVQVVRVSLDERRIDLEPAQNGKDGAQRPSSSGRAESAGKAKKRASVATGDDAGAQSRKGGRGSKASGKQSGAKRAKAAKKGCDRRRKPRGS